MASSSSSTLSTAAGETQSPWRFGVILFALLPRRHLNDEQILQPATTGHGEAVRSHDGQSVSPMNDNHSDYMTIPTPPWPNPKPSSRRFWPFSWLCFRSLNDITRFKHIVFTPSLRVSCLVRVDHCPQPLPFLLQSFLGVAVAIDA
ncbi:hypothetical protein RRG08_059294 [Elysia crispata]|uniref:Uncharacterized protein n=1 Tax=Elysia crispata TaxID=231223 RepID=A0AAE0ZCP8_9GAST|nr:hypothetical protein RRG08_059294 [Elysia crispata]